MQAITLRERNQQRNVDLGQVGVNLALTRNAALERAIN